MCPKKRWKKQDFMKAPPKINTVSPSTTTSGAGTLETPSEKGADFLAEVPLIAGNENVRTEWLVHWEAGTW